MEIKDVIDGIAMKLSREFPGYTIYVDKVPQNFKTPSFFIQLINIDHVRQIGNKWQIAPLFNIQYFSDKGNTDLYNHTFLINQALERIELLNGDIILARNMNSTIANDIANNFMNFDFRVNVEALKIYMESFDFTSKLKEV